MSTAATKRSIEVVLVGGGASNVQIVRALHGAPIPGVNFTLVSDSKYSIYCGILPAVIEDKCQQEGSMVSMTKLAEYGGCKFVHGKALHVDPDAREVIVEPQSNPSNKAPTKIRYDILSINVGSITLSSHDIPGVDKYSIKTRPAKDVMPRIAAFEKQWFQEHGGSDRPLRMCVIGAGMAGIELAASVKKRFERRVKEKRFENSVECTVISHVSLQKCLKHPTFARRVQRALDRRQIRTLFGPEVVQVKQNTVVLDDTSTVPYDVCIYAAGAAPPLFVLELGASGTLGLSSSKFITIQTTLQTTQSDIFAAGDCTTMIGYEDIPKAGVYAVKEGPTLTHNVFTVARALVRASQECPPGDNAAWEQTRARTLQDISPKLRAFNPPRRILQIINLGDGTGIANRNGFTIEGSLVWRLKIALDRQWVKGFNMCIVSEEDLAEPVSRK